MNKRLARLSMLLAIAIIMGYLEALIPISPGLPGMKIGLANYIIVLTLYLFSGLDAVIINILRIFVVGFLFSNLSMIVYSFAGALGSLTAMILLKKSGWFSKYGVSAIGGMMHNLGQFAVASFIMGFHAVLWYLPILMIAGLIAGLVIAFLVSITEKRIRKSRLLMED